MFWNKGSGIAGRLGAVLSVAASLFLSVPAAQADDVKPWKAIIGSWNLENFGNKKSGLSGNIPKDYLMTRIATIAKDHHIIFFQEVQGTGQSVLNKDRGLQHFMPSGWVCNWVSSKVQPRANGKPNRSNHERYSYCISNTPTSPGGQPVYITSQTDYAAAGAPARKAIDGSQQNANEVWTRPPSILTLKIPRPGQSDLEIDVYDNHLLLKYKDDRPDGTPANSPVHSAVGNELKALQDNLNRQNTGILILGDFNADCDYYRSQYRAGKFTDTQNWTWWIKYKEKTNAIPNGTNCAYDRFIGNNVVKNVFQGYGITTQGIWEEDPKKRPSNHYKVSLTLGEGDQKALGALVVVAGENIADRTRAKRKQAFGTVNMTTEGKKSKLEGDAQGLSAPAGTKTKVYLLKYDSRVNYDGLVDIPLHDAESDPDSFGVDTDGTLVNSWENEMPAPGAYKLALDVAQNGVFDGVLNVYKGDIVNPGNAIDILIAERDYHSDVVTIGDRGTVQEVFFENKAQNIYGLARGLPVNSTFNGYVISLKLIEDRWESWEKFKAAVGQGLLDYAVPVKHINGPIYAARMPAEKKTLTLETDAHGHVFKTIWAKPSILLNKRAFRQNIARLPVTDETIIGNCDDEWMAGKTADQRKICNYGNLFSDFYGYRFNFVIDLDGNGNFGPGDRIDDYDIGHMREYFNTPENTELGPSSGSIEAVSEYKNFLSARLSMAFPLNQSNDFDAATIDATHLYLRQDVLTKNDFNTFVAKDAVIGFHVVDSTIQKTSKAFENGFFQFEDYIVRETTIADNSSVSTSGCDAELGTVAFGVNGGMSARFQTVKANGAITAKERSGMAIKVTQNAVFEDGFVVGSRNGFQFVATAAPSIKLLPGCGY